MKVEIGDKFTLSFSGAGNQEGANYEVYHVTGRAKNVPSNPDDNLVFLKLTSRTFFQLGAPFSVCVPEKNIEEFFKVKLR